MTNKYDTGYDDGLNNREKTGMSEDYFEGYEQGTIRREDRENDDLF